MKKAKDRSHAQPRNYVLTKIEKLNVDSPGLMTAVKRWFDAGVSSREVPALVKEQFGVSITEGMAEVYRCRRWAPEKQRMNEKKETRNSVVETIGGDAGFDAFALAKLWELMDDMSVPQLMSTRQLFVKVRAQNLKEQEFLYKSGQMTPGQAGAEAPDAQTQQRNVLRRIKEIFGITPDEEEENAPASRPALPADATEEPKEA